MALSLKEAGRERRVGGGGRAEREREEVRMGSEGRGVDR